MIVHYGVLTLRLHYLSVAHPFGGTLGALCKHNVNSR